MPEHPIAHIYLLSSFPSLQLLGSSHISTKTRLDTKYIQDNPGVIRHLQLSTEEQSKYTNITMSSLRGSMITNLKE